MKKIIIFGKEFEIIEQNSDKDTIEFENNKIIINSFKIPSNLLLNEFLVDLLYSQLHKTYDEIKRKRIEVFGNLDFKIVNKIDSKRQRVAKLKGNKILIKINAITLPKSALKYIIAHEIAHIFSKRHTRKFWEIVETIYPKYKKGQELFLKYGDILSRSSIY